jgi:two-component system, LytTR family, response regulator LytT
MTQGLRVLVVDDERPALEDLGALLRAHDDVGSVVLADSGRDALNLIADAPFDAVFLDVRMPALNGLELARLLRRFAVPPALVFVSAYGSPAVEAFELQAVDYILKPVSRQRLDQAIARVVRHVAAPALAAETPAGGDGSDVIAVAMPRGGTRLLERGSILYLQSYGDYVRVVSTEGRFLLRARLVDLQERWSPHGFVRVHRKYVVNLRRAVELRPRVNGTAVLVMGDSSEVPIARRQVPDLRRRLGA